MWPVPLLFHDCTLELLGTVMVAAVELLFFYACSTGLPPHCADCPVTWTWPFNVCIHIPFINANFTSLTGWACILYSSICQRKPMQRCAPPGTPLMWCMFCCLQGFVCLFKKHIYLWITCFLWLNKAWNTIYAFPVSLSMRAIYIKISLHCKHQATETWSFNSVVQSHRTAYTSQFSPNVTAHSSDQLANHRALRFS